MAIRTHWKRENQACLNEAQASGSGKTWCSSGSLKWWQGYDGYENVILDDFRGDFAPLHYMLQVLDRYPFSVEVKGGSRQLLAKRIWITCPYTPEEVYKTARRIARRTSDSYCVVSTQSNSLNTVLHPLRKMD